MLYTILGKYPVHIYFRLFITFTELVTKTTHYMTKKIQNSFQFDFFLIISYFSVFSSLPLNVCPYFVQ